MTNITAIDNLAHQPMNQSVQISMCVVVVCLYLIGVFVHTKVISACKRDKHVTWKLDVANSFILIFCYGNIIVMNGLTIFVKDLYMYTASWFCYAYKLFTVYGNAYVSGHSLIIAIMK